MVTVTGTEPVPVVLSISHLVHDLDGTPQFPDDPSPVLTVDPQRATVRPGTTIAAHVTGAIPDASPALYAGLVIALDKPPTGGVDVVTRVGVPLLLRGPQPWHPAATIEDLTLPATPQGQPARVEALIRDTGDVHIHPTGTFTILRDGQVVGTATLQGETVLPTLARRLGASWSPPTGLQGPLTVRLQLTDPSAVQKADGLRFPPDPTDTAASNDPSSRSSQSKGSLGATAPRGSDHNNPSRLLAGLIALVAILAVTIAAAALRRRPRRGGNAHRKNLA